MTFDTPMHAWPRTQRDLRGHVSQTFHVAQSVLNSAMKLDMKLFSEEYRTLRRPKKESRNSVVKNKIK
jgi:hypothetical protein